MKTAHQMVATMGLVIEGNSAAIERSRTAPKILSIVGIAAIMSKDNDDRLADIIKGMTSQLELTDIRAELVAELEEIACNCISCVAQQDIDDMYVVTSAINLIDLVGKLMVEQQEKEDDVQINL